MKKLTISLDYLKRESVNPERSVDWVDMKTGDSVYDWTIHYLKRNKIPHILSDDQLIIEFKSYHQQRCFVYAGNRIFPYFEFW